MSGSINSIECWSASDHHRRGCSSGPVYICRGRGLVRLAMAMLARTKQRLVCDDTILLNSRFYLRFKQQTCRGLSQIQRGSSTGDADAIVRLKRVPPANGLIGRTGRPSHQGVDLGSRDWYDSGPRAQKSTYRLLKFRVGNGLASLSSRFPT